MIKLIFYISILLTQDVCLASTFRLRSIYSVLSKSLALEKTTLL